MKRDKIIWNPTFEAELTIKTRKLSLKKEEITLDLTKPTQYTKVLLQAAELKRSSSRIPNKLKPHLEFLLEAGILVKESEVPINITSEFLFSKGLLKLVPIETLKTIKDTIQIGSLCFNEHVKLQNGTPRPVEGMGIPPENDFPIKGNLIWVFEPTSQVWSVFRINKKWHNIISQLKDKPSSISTLDVDTILLLVASKILINKEDLNNTKRKWQKKITTAKESIETEQYAVIRDVISPLQIASLRKLSRDLEKGGYLKIDRSQGQGQRLFLHNGDAFNFIHRQLASLIRNITQEPLMPSYSFLSAYMHNSALARHLDRPQCKWNASLLVDFNPNVELEKSWPIYLEVNGKAKEVRLSLGDMVVYRGTEIPHWRPMIEAGHRQTLLLLHYVPLSFTGTLK